MRIVIYGLIGSNIVNLNVRKFGFFSVGEKKNLISFLMGRFKVCLSIYVCFGSNVV